MYNYTRFFLFIYPYIGARSNRVIEKKDAILTRKNYAYEAGATLSVRETMVDNQNIMYAKTMHNLKRWAPCMHGIV